MAYINRTELYVELVQEILNKNKDVFSVDFIQNGLKGLIEGNPILSKLSIDDNFLLKSELPDFKGSLEALKTFLDFLYNYLKKLISEADFKERFVIVGENFIQERSGEILQSDLLNYIPAFFFEEKGNREPLNISSLRNESKTNQVLIIFESIFTIYLQEAFQMDDKNLFFSEVLDLKKSFPILNRFLIKKNGDVTITPSDEDEQEKLVSELSDVFNYFVDFSSYNLGGDMAVKRAQESIKPIFDLLEDLPENLGILNHILNGAMTNRIPTGIPGFDSMIQGGLPRGKAVLIQAPSGSEKNFFISHFIRNCLEHKSNLIMILSQISPKIFKMQLKTLGVDTDRFGKEERIKIIDWYSWRKNDNNSTNQGDDSIIYAGVEFSDLMHTFENSMNGLKYTPTKCAVIDIITPALNTYEFDQVQDFGKKLIEKLKKNNITSLFIIEKESHKKEDIAKLRTLFDGVIDIENEESDGKINSKIRILFMHDTKYESEYRLLVLDGTKLNVSPA